MRDRLGGAGFVHVQRPFASLGEAWNVAGKIVGQAGGTLDLDVIGEFVLPPPGGLPSREFQTLHFDFGLPLVPAVPGDVARFTALHVTADVTPSDALTRLVPLRALLSRRQWPDRAELIRRFASYGRSHGAWDDGAGYIEGSLARIVEAALGAQPVLPSVKDHPEFLCGAEFASLAAETDFLTRRGLCPEPVQIEIRLRSGELLVFDNLALAHGRRGVRQPGELHQRVFGHRALTVEGQLDLRDQLLDAFDEHRDWGPSSPTPGTGS